MPERFELISNFRPDGDQPGAIKKIVRGFREGHDHQTLLGVTGSGKTFTMAHTIAELNRPTLVLSHNKTLAAQLYREFKDLFPNNAVEYFVSYYDYYQPEAYLPNRDLFIEKDASVNEELDRVRLSATQSLLQRRDVIVVASVSCIYGIGSPEEYLNMRVSLETGEEIDRDTLLRALVDIQYERNDQSFFRGSFRVRGDVIDVYRGFDDKNALRIELFGDEIESLSEIDPLRGTRLRRLKSATVFPAAHFVTSSDRLKQAMVSIRSELADRLDALRGEDRLVEAQRLEQRTRYDLEMLEEMGYCQGIENYSRHIEGRLAGEPACTLLDYFPSDWLMFIDESHVSLPQIRAMYNGDRSRKSVLVEHGFRLPSALDNRPLRFEEFEERVNQMLYVSATPSDYELEKSQGRVIEQIIRPTGLLEPEIEIFPATNQVDHLLGEIRKRVEAKQRVLVTTLTKRMAEDLTEYYRELGLSIRYLHADINTIERTEIIRDLRLGEFDILVGVNLLREGLDLPEVSLVAILDADKEGFLRNKTSLIQTCGRAARNLEGKVFLYADRMTQSMKATIDEIDRRRETQKAYNKKHGLTPRTIVKNISTMLDNVTQKDYVDMPRVAEPEGCEYVARKDLPKRIVTLRKEMFEAAGALEFERAANLRDEIENLENELLEL